MLSGQTTFVILSPAWIVCPDVTFVVHGELLDCLLDGLDAIFAASFSRGNVGVGSGSVPVPANWFRVEGDANAELLSDSVQEEPGNPQVVSD